MNLGLSKLSQQEQQTRSCWDPETAVIHFWSPGGVRRRLQGAASAAAAAAASADIWLRPPPSPTKAAAAAVLRPHLMLLCIANSLIKKVNYY